MLTVDQREQFDQQGYLVMPGILPDKLIREILSEAALLSAANPEAKSRVWHERALFRRKAFREVLDVEPLVNTARDLIGEDVQLLAMDLLLVRAGAGGIRWHRDVHFVCNKTLSINTGIYLQDMIEQMGPLRVAPGTHRAEDFPPDSAADPLPGQIEVPVTAGSAVFFDAGLWHTGGVNRSSADRWALFPYWGRYWVKRMDNYYTQPLPADLLSATDPVKRQLLGRGLRPGVASYHGDDESYNRRGEAGIDYPAGE